jgi:hypothetical protein
MLLNNQANGKLHENGWKVFFLPLAQFVNLYYAISRPILVVLLGEREAVGAWRVELDFLARLDTK